MWHVRGVPLNPNIERLIFNTKRSAGLWAGGSVGGLCAWGVAAEGANEIREPAVA